MAEFRSARWRIGLAVLLLALMFTVGWVRSFGHEETFHLCPNRSLIVFASGNGGLSFMWLNYLTHDFAESKSVTIANSRFKRWHLGHSYSPSKRDDEPSYLLRHIEVVTSEWKYVFGPFLMAHQTLSYLDISEPSTEFVISVPYWSVVCPLSLIALCLLEFRNQSTKRLPGRDEETRNPPETHAAMKY